MNKKEEKICQKLFEMNYQSKKIKEEKVVPNTGGLYAIKDEDTGFIIYAGHSSHSIRKRLLAHIGSYDGQDIGDFLEKQDLCNIYVSWVIEKQAKCLEDKFIECITENQGKHPEFNRTRGKQCEEE